MYKESKGCNKKKIVSRFKKKNQLIMEFQLEDGAIKKEGQAICPVLPEWLQISLLRIQVKLSF